MLMAGKKAVRQPRKPSPKEAHPRPLCWEEKRRQDPFLVWDGSYRWFRSENVVPLERHRTTKEIDQIRVNVLLRRIRYRR